MKTGAYPKTFLSLLSFLLLSSAAYSTNNIPSRYISIYTPKEEAKFSPIIPSNSDCTLNITTNNLGYDAVFILGLEKEMMNKGYKIMRKLGTESISKSGVQNYSKGKFGDIWLYTHVDKSKVKKRLEVDLSRTSSSVLDIFYFSNISGFYTDAAIKKYVL